MSYTAKGNPLPELPDAPGSTDTRDMERITGPHQGFWIASHASETGDRFLGYAKICRRRPESYWDANCLVKLCGDDLHGDAPQAIAEVERRARDQLRALGTPQPAYA
jgi:hypothetical protein